MELRVETYHTEAIKPSSPTPINLKNLKLSLLDQMASVYYIPIIFWYSSPEAEGAAIGDHFPKTAKERSWHLKKSLSETLTRFYPFAGRINNCVISCNDEGVDYMEARVNCLLQDILKRPNVESLTKFLPIKTESPEAATGRLLLIKVSFFQCGGMAIGVSLSHKIADLCSLGNFINSWSATARGCPTTAAVIVPKFNCAASFLPPTKPSFTIPAMELKRRQQKGTTTTTTSTRRLVFDASKISVLKTISACATVPHPTRVEAVSAFIWKCLTAASTKPSVLRQVVNLRNRLQPPLPQNSVGYLVSYFTVQKQSWEKEMQGMVKKLRNGIKEFSENYVKKIQGIEAISTLFDSAIEVGNLSKRDDIDFYHCVSWCKFDLYGADFGPGKPVWVSIAGSTVPNSFILMDMKDGSGIEAWVGLSEEEMGFFECNEELLAFASVNPSVYYGSVFHSY